MSEELPLGLGSRQGWDAVKTGRGKGAVRREAVAQSAAKVKKTWTLTACPSFSSLSHVLLHFQF